jgi:hypothetical protein
MKWYEIFNSVFWITVITMLMSLIGLLLKYCLKTKCDNVKCCWGMIEVNRDVELEAMEENIEEMKDLGINELYQPN